MSNGHSEQSTEAYRLALLLDGKRLQGTVVLSNDVAAEVQIALEDAATAHRLLVTAPGGPAPSEEAPDQPVIERAVAYLIDDEPDEVRGVEPTHAEANRSGEWSFIRAARMACDTICDLIENVDQRAMACDGPVTPTRLEMTDDEMRDVYEIAKLARADLTNVLRAVGGVGAGKVLPGGRTGSPATQEK